MSSQEGVQLAKNKMTLTAEIPGQLVDILKKNMIIPKLSCF